MKIWQVLKKSTSQTYDKLFKFAILNVIWFLLSTVVVYIGYYGLYLRAYYLLIVPIIFIGPFFISGLMMGIDYIKFKDFVIKKYFSYIKENFKRGLVGFLFTFFIYIILFVDFVFFFRKGTDNLFMLILAVLILYIIIFFSMMQCTFWGYLALNKDLSIKKVIKNSFLTTIDNLVFTFLWFIVVLIISSILIITGFGIAVLLMNFVSLMVLHATIEISSKYDKIEIEELNQDE
ncbi:MAG: DUF624 domain-containing protein [Halanaerobiales bacterium]|nr:DUF624 domain-containing protein [Halanaerobiales bacterium]